MNIQDFFRQFVRLQYQEVEASNEDLDEMALAFEKYLFDKVGEEKARSWYPLSIVKLIQESDHPLKMYGFEPALVIHFGNYVKDVAKEYEQELKNKP